MSAHTLGPYLRKRQKSKQSKGDAENWSKEQNCDFSSPALNFPEIANTN